MVQVIRQPSSRSSPFADQIPSQATGRLGFHGTFFDNCVHLGAGGFNDCKEVSLGIGSTHIFKSPKKDVSLHDSHVPANHDRYFTGMDSGKLKLATSERNVTSFKLVFAQGTPRLTVQFNGRDVQTHSVLDLDTAYQILMQRKMIASNLSWTAQDLLSFVLIALLRSVKAERTA